MTDPRILYNLTYKQNMGEAFKSYDEYNNLVSIDMWANVNILFLLN